MWRDIKRIIQNHQQFILTTHLNPDGDGIGAACALTELLLQMGKSVRFVCDSPIPRKFDFLDYHATHENFSAIDNYLTCEVLFMLDTHKSERIGRLADLIDRPGLTTVCIDHHEIEKCPTAHVAIDPKACSVGAMVYTLYKESGYDLNQQAATGIYTSIICDTGRFSYSSTSRKAHKIADECIKLGVDPDWIHSHLFQHVSLAEIKLFARALQDMETHLDNKVIIQHIRQEDYGHHSEDALDLEHIDLEYIHDFNNIIEDVQCIVLLRELENNRVRVSLRSKTDLDVSKIVGSFGGGGHPNAAGATWNGSINEVKQHILNLLKAYFKSQELANKRAEAQSEKLCRR